MIHEKLKDWKTKVYYKQGNVDVLRPGIDQTLDDVYVYSEATLTSIGLKDTLIFSDLNNNLKARWELYLFVDLRIDNSTNFHTMHIAMTEYRGMTSLYSSSINDINPELLSFISIDDIVKLKQRWIWKENLPLEIKLPRELSSFNHGFMLSYNEACEILNAPEEKVQEWEKAWKTKEISKKFGL
jgi:hypothetical protein